MDEVYPRVGGGNARIVRGSELVGGLSPRGRGKRENTANPERRKRSIPAWAGETPGKYIGQRELTVYPRVGGGNSSVRLAASAIAGLSPRGRGKPTDLPVMPTGAGSIPAWAGETTIQVTGAPSRQVYPRVGGGNARARRIGGSSGGLSPRGRGKPAAEAGELACVGSIPAWAGETAARRGVSGAAAVYPRVGGGNGGVPRPCVPTRGLSPRGRGKQVLTMQFALNRRSIPAWAGETRAPRRRRQ